MGQRPGPDHRQAEVGEGEGRREQRFLLGPDPRDRGVASRRSKATRVSGDRGDGHVVNKTGEEQETAAALRDRPQWRQGGRGRPRRRRTHEGDDETRCTTTSSSSATRRGADVEVTQSPTLPGVRVRIGGTHERITIDRRQVFGDQRRNRCAGVRLAAGGGPALLPELWQAAGRAAGRLPPGVGDAGGDAPEPRGAGAGRHRRSRPRTTKAERDYAPLAAVGGIAMLGLMLLVGVLIGKGNNQTAAAPAPIVTVGERRAAAPRLRTGQVRSGRGEAEGSGKQKKGRPAPRQSTAA